MRRSSRSRRWPRAPAVVAAAGTGAQTAKLAKIPPREKLAAREMPAREFALRVAEKRGTDRGVDGAPDPASVAPSSSDGGTLSAADMRVAKADPGVATHATALDVVARWSAEEIATARQQCTRLLAKSAAVTSEAEPLKEGACGTPAPVSLRRAGTPAVEVQPASTMNCAVAAELSNWLTDKVQPAAKELFKSPWCASSRPRHMPAATDMAARIRP